jgi:hypothetical protein
MNVDELRSGLTTLAAQVDVEPATVAADAHARLARVDRLVARARRLRVAAAAGAAVAVVSAAGLVASELPRDSATPPASGLSTVEDNGVSLYASPAGGVLVGHVVGDPGARTLTLTVTPKSLDLAWSVECANATASDGPLPRRSPDEFSLSVNGHPISSGSCDDVIDRTPMNADSYFGFGAPKGNVVGWRDLGLRVGQPSTFTVRRTSPTTEGRNPQLALGLWQRGPQNHDSGVWYPHELIVDGATYVSESISTDPFAARRAAISVRIGTQYDRYWITGGAERLDGGNGVLQVGDGAMAALDATGGAELGAGYKPPHDPVPVTFRSHHHATVSGLLYAIVYHPLDGP